MDYEYAIQNIRRHMHDPRGSKAAVMVGAGFSRNALSLSGTSADSFPDWASLTRTLVDRLYINADDARRVLTAAGETSSALRIAEEFEAAHGRPALIDLVAQSLPDQNYSPSTLHADLMDLDWADVFTTNYDRFLERALIEHRLPRLRVRRYDLVLTAADLPLARRPRIFKLHGTLPDLTNLVLTEDDFRRYPIDHAPFVNAVRSSLSENLFCLFGFSGDDPNFLAWTGWIRDVLKQATPPIYLFRACSPKPFQRKLLEKRNVVVIPVCELSGKQDIKLAFQWLFEKLSEPLDRPTANWNMGPTLVESITSTQNRSVREPLFPKELKSDWLQAASIWHAHRLEYKGWHVLYRRGIEQLWVNTQFWLRRLLPNEVAEWDLSEAIFVVRELVWRTSLALQPLPDAIVDQIILPLLKRLAVWQGHRKNVTITLSLPSSVVVMDETALAEFQLQMHLELVRHAREIGDDERFAREYAEAIRLCDALSLEETSDKRQFLIHQNVLWSLGRFRHNEARFRLQNWKTQLVDDVWSIRKAGLLLEVGAFDQAANLLVEVLNRVVKLRNGTDIDYRVRSTEGLALHLLWHQSQFLSLHSAQPTQAVPTDTAIAADGFDVEADKPVSGDIKRTAVPPQIASKGEFSEAGTLPEETTIRRRLRELGELGCDPCELLDWLRLLNASRITMRPAIEEHELFDPGHSTKTFSSGDFDVLEAAYRTIRFIEEAGLPLLIDTGHGLSICQELFRNASSVISAVSPSEGLQLALRSRDHRHIESFLTRATLVRLNDTQLNPIFEAALEVANVAVRNITTADASQELGLQFDRELRHALSILNRIVVRLAQPQAKRVGEFAIRLAGNSELWIRTRAGSELAALIRRALESIDLTMTPDLLTDSMKVSVPGSTSFPLSADKLHHWYDPVDALDLTSSFVNSDLLDNSQLLSAMLDNIASASGSYRERLVVRAVTMLAARVFSHSRQLQLRDALFAKTDEYGFPTDTGCYDSLILGLPRAVGKNERGMFVQKYFRVDVSCEAFADNIKRSVSRFGRPLGATNRSVQWNSGDLTKILAYVGKCIPAYFNRIKGGRTRDGHPFKLHLAENKYDESLRTFQTLVGVLEEVVLLSPNLSSMQQSVCAEILSKCDTDRCQLIRPLPTLVYCGMQKSHIAVSAISDALLSRSIDRLTEACLAVSRWSELVRAQYLSDVPGQLLDVLGQSLNTVQDDRLVLLLRTARNVVDIVGCKRKSFVKHLLLALRQLLVDYSYDARSGSMGQCVLVRLRCLELAAAMRARGSLAPEVQRWMQEACSDPFNDVKVPAAFLSLKLGSAST